MHFGGNIFGNLLFGGINFRTNNMFIKIGLFPIVVSIIFSLIANLFGSSNYYYTDDYYYEPAQNRNQRPQNINSRHRSQSQAAYNDSQSIGFLDFNYALLFVLFMFLGVIIKKVMR